MVSLLALPCRIAEFSCVPPHSEEDKTVDPNELSTNNHKLLNHYFWQMVMYRQCIEYRCVCNLDVPATARTIQYVIHIKSIISEPQRVW